MMSRTGILIFSLLVSFPLAAQTLTLDLDTAIEKALLHDPRISELEALVRVAEATVREVEGHGGVQANVYGFLGLSPGLTGGLFTGECGDQVTCENRRDRYTLEEGLSLWNYMDFRIVKPLYTFGKLENYGAAAQADVKIKKQTVKLQRADTIYEIKKAYYGYLTARDTGLFLKDMRSRLDGALNQVQAWLDEGKGSARQSDLYALNTAVSLVDSYIAQAKALENIAMSALYLLTGIEKSTTIAVKDRRIMPAQLPDSALADLQQQALEQRPEMLQLEQGLKARRALIAANKALNRPNIVAGFGGMVSYSPGRERLDNPHIYDPFSDVGGTPVLGMQWDWNGSLGKARVSKAQAELDALIEKGSFARKGIPFQVEEAYKQVQAFHSAVGNMEKSARSARRWMIATYADFEAGVQEADKLVAAFQGYVLAYTEYLQTVFNYNMHVAQMTRVAGGMK